MPEDKPSPENPESNAARQDSATPPRRRAHRGIGCFLLLILLLVVAFILFPLWSAKRSKPAEAPPPVAISTTVATNGDIGIYVTALGSVTPVNTVTITSLATGRLLRVNYVEGQLVHSNDLLVEIDPGPYEAQLKTAQGMYDRDQALLAQSQINLARYQAAYASNGIPRQQLEDQQALVRQNEGTVRLDLGQLENIQLQLAYCRITSPIAGRAGLRLVDPGNVVVANISNVLVVVTQLQPITVLFSVAEDYLPQIQQQLNRRVPMPVEAYDRTQEKKIAAGELLAVDSQIEPTTGTIRIRAIFPNEDFALFPNQFVNAKLRIDMLRGVTLVPTDAIQRGSQGAFVFLVQNGNRVTMRTVTVGVTDGNVTSVTGVEPGEVLATDNFNRLQEGAKVTVRQAEVANPKGGP